MYADLAISMEQLLQCFLYLVEFFFWWLLLLKKLHLAVKSITELFSLN